MDHSGQDRMNASVTPISGIAEKSPAAFLVEVAGRRVLLDLGQGSMPSDRPAPETIGEVDAVIISHAHKDHCGALDLLPAIGSPRVHATRSVLDRLDVGNGVELPAKGTANVCGIEVLTGRSGHALGSIWLRVGGEDGVLYMGDSCIESNVFGFDDPPTAQTLILDASYGDAEEPREPQAQRLLSIAMKGPLHCPVPPDGRGIEIALALDAAGFRLAVDDEIRAMLGRLAGADAVYAQPDAAVAAARLAQTAGSAEPGFDGVTLTADATGGKGASARLIEGRGDGAPALLFTGHLASDTPGRRLVTAGSASKMRWNVHPTLSHNLDLLRRVAPSEVIAAFGPGPESSDWRRTLQHEAEACGH